MFGEGKLKLREKVGTAIAYIGQVLPGHQQRGSAGVRGGAGGSGNTAR